MSIEIPKDLEFYFNNRSLQEYPESRICPLNKEKSLELHQELIKYDPIFEELGLVPLDEANDSNPYCYVLKTPMSGCVFHYSHDGDRIFKFTSIENWVRSLSKAGEESKSIDDIEYEKRVDSKDVPALCRYIESTYDNETGYFSEGTVYLIQGLNEDCLSIIEKLAINSDFFIREAVAQLISDKPCLQYMNVAQLLSNDKYGQVSGPAKIALKRINKMIKQ